MRVSEVRHPFFPHLLVLPSSTPSQKDRGLRLNVVQINVPVKLQSDEQDAVIKPGDYLIGDLNGVVCLPKELAEKAIPLLGSQVEADEKIALELDRGMAFTEASKKHRGGLWKA